MPNCTEVSSQPEGSASAVHGPAEMKALLYRLDHTLAPGRQSFFQHAGHSHGTSAVAGHLDLVCNSPNAEACHQRSLCISRGDELVTKPFAIRPGSKRLKLPAALSCKCQETSRAHGSASGFAWPWTHLTIVGGIGTRLACLAPRPAPSIHR